jgi:hypothetical protein
MGTPGQAGRAAAATPLDSGLRAFRAAGLTDDEIATLLRRRFEAPPQQAGAQGRHDTWFVGGCRTDLVRGLHLRDRKRGCS